MGSDDLFKNRKARKLKERKISFRRSFDRVQHQLSFQI